MNLDKEFTYTPFHVSYLARKIRSACIDEMAGSGLPNVIRRRDSFWTVGMATYKDGYKDLDPKTVKENNAILYNYFEDLYRYQLDHFAYLTDKPVKYMEGLPLPGFHVFKYCEDFTKPLARPHVDVPYNKYDWGRSIGEGEIFTHVVPVELPDNAGMYVWDLTAYDMAIRGENTVVLEARSTPPKALIPHKVDMCCTHSGMIVHQIKPFDGPTDKWRITLQSHAVFKDGAWQLYW